MQSDLHLLWFALRHYPLAVLGFALIGTSSCLFFHIKYTMHKAGHNVNLWSRHVDLALPMRYLRERSRRNWSPWPAYLALPCLIGGLILLVAGLFLMSN